MSDVPVEIKEALLAGWRSAPPRPENALVVLCECGYESAMVHVVNPKRRTRILCDDDASTLGMNYTKKPVTCLECLAYFESPQY